MKAGHPFHLFEPLDILNAHVDAFLGLLLFGFKLYQLFFLKNHRPERLRNGTETLLFLGGAGLASGIMAVCLGTWRFFRLVSTGSHLLPGDFANLLVRGSAMMILALTAALILAFCWLVLMEKIHKIEIAEAMIRLQLQ